MIRAILRWLKPTSFSVLVFGFYAVILLIPDSYDVFGALLVLLSIVVAAVVRPRLFPLVDRKFSFLLALYPLSLLPSFVLKGGHFDFLDYPIRCLLVVPLLVGLRTYSDRFSFEKACFFGASLGGIAAGIFSLKGLLIDHVGRVGYPLTNPIPYGQIAAILALIAFASFSRFEKNWCRILSAVGFIGAVYAVYASGSAGALAGFSFGFLVEFILLCRRNISKLMAFVLVALFAMALLIAMPLVSLKLAQFISDLHAFSAGSGMGTSQGQRLILWGMSLREIVHSPFLGIGPGNFDAVMDRYCELNPCSVDFRGFHGVHNQYLDSFMNGGVIAFLGLLASYIVPLILFLRRSLSLIDNYSISAIAGAAVVVAAMVSAVTQVFYGHNISVISYFFTLAFLWFLSAPSPGEGDQACG